GQKLDCGRDHQLRVAALILSRIGVEPAVLIGHSRAGMEAMAAGVEYFAGIPAHGLNPAALIDRPEIGQDPNTRVRLDMNLLTTLTNDYLNWLSGKLSNIEAGGDYTSVILKIVGRVPGIDRNDWIRLGRRYMAIMKASNAKEVRTNNHAMQLMAQGQGLPTSGRVQKGDVIPYERTFLTTTSSGDKDYFVQTEELRARQYALYKYLLNEAWGEDFGLTKKDLKDPRNGKLRDVCRQIFAEQNMANEGGHHNFYDASGNGESFRRRLARFIFRSAKERTITDADISLAVAVLEMPIILNPEFDKTKLKVITLDQITDGQPHLVYISLEQYIKIQALYLYAGLPGQNTWELFRLKRRETMMQRDLSSLHVFIADHTGQIERQEFDTQVRVMDYTIRQFLLSFDPHTDFSAPQFLRDGIGGVKKGEYAGKIREFEKVLSLNPLYKGLQKKEKHALLYEIIPNLLKQELTSMGLK
ncbi:MAG: hypothetical protein AAB874_03580, partial [Patescibacteria group bacterium]